MRIEHVVDAEGQRCFFIFQEIFAYRQVYTVFLQSFSLRNHFGRFVFADHLQHKFQNNFDITPSVNLQYRKVKAEMGDLNLSNHGFSWESKLIANYKIETEKPSFFNNFGFQMIGEYESPEVVPQGKRMEQYSVDLALRKDFLKDKKASLTFSINDVFNTHRYGSVYDTENFYQESFSRRNVRSFRINFSLRFGKADFKVFNRENQRSDEDE